MTYINQESTLTAALRHFEKTEANLLKLERLWLEIYNLIPKDILFEENETFDENCRDYNIILQQIPKIDGWKPNPIPYDLNSIAQTRLDVLDMGEFGNIEDKIALDNYINSPGKELKEYRFFLNQKREELIRDEIISLVEKIDEILQSIQKTAIKNSDVSDSEWNVLRSQIAQINTLLGSKERPDKWNDLHRHMRFAELHDLDDIINSDWPQIKKSLLIKMYGANDPIPSEIDDLSTLIATKPKGIVTSELKWENLSSELFERLIFNLISTENGYENPQWLTKTNAPDRGRDLSVIRIFSDKLTGVIRFRVIIQCRHWLSKSISINDVCILQSQMKLWEPPIVNIVIIATSGCFTTDAIDYIEKINNSDQALRIEMWANSHLEMLLASRPALIAEFKLR